MKVMSGWSLCISLISQVKKSAGTSSTMSHLNPSTPIPAQKFTMSSILSHVRV